MTENPGKVAPIRPAGPVEGVGFVPERGPQRPGRVKRGLARKGSSYPSISHEIGRDLQEVLLKALEKDRNRRHSSVAELAEELMGCLEAGDS